jgi:hypothetical protein
MKFYNTRYSNTKDLSTPQFQAVGNHVYPTHHNKEAGGAVAKPWFEIKKDKIYPTLFHPQGRSMQAWYEIDGNRVKTTSHHPMGRTNFPIFQIKKY